MIAFVTAINERTLPLCEWSLRRNGFEVCVINNETTLAQKLEMIYEWARDDFLRVDADVIVNRDCTESNILEIAQLDQLKDAWWIQFSTFGWYSQRPIHGGVQFIKKEALPVLRENVRHFMKADRPETELSRSYGMYNPRRFESFDQIMGIHGYGIKDLKPVIKQKARRGQSANYDFELAQRLNEL